MLDGRLERKMRAYKKEREKKKKQRKRERNERKLGKAFIHLFIDFIDKDYKQQQENDRYCHYYR